MKKNINFKNNKGISLISVIVTLVLMTIILTSIVYSNNRTNEIKQAMLLNSDIEELTKKVEMYYLDKEALPITYDENFCYKEENKVDEPKEPVCYYKIETSLLENLNLNNKENDDQWYVMNPETHNIYFLKVNGSTIEKMQEDHYKSKYDSIIELADSSINFNNASSSSRRRNFWYC